MGNSRYSNFQALYRQLTSKIDNNTQIEGGRYHKWDENKIRRKIHQSAFYIRPHMLLYGEMTVLTNHFLIHTWSYKIYMKKTIYGLLKRE